MNNLSGGENFEKLMTESTHEVVKDNKDREQLKKEAQRIKTKMLKSLETLKANAEEYYEKYPTKEGYDFKVAVDLSFRSLTRNR